MPAMTKTPESVTPEQAAELTASCSEVRPEWHAPENERWVAVHWCNVRGESLVGIGPTALAAVLDVHAKVRTEHAYG